MNILKESEINKLSTSAKKYYYEILREYCLSLKSNPNISTGQKLISKIAPIQRNFDYEVIGAENLPKDGAVIVCNHSNSHDFFTALESFNNLGLPVSVFAANDDLNFLSSSVFNFANATLVDRNDKQSCQNGLLELTGKVMNGNYGVIFGESTWNLHPYRAMNALKLGPARSACISGRQIVPTIFEYVEVPNLCEKEKELYSKCIIKFGKPITINPNIDSISQMLYVEEIMINMRRELWQEQGKLKAGMKIVDPNLYVNHTWLKKFDALAFEYDSESEFKYLYFRGNTPKENGYHLNEKRLFVPGITRKEDKARVLVPLRKK